MENERAKYTKEGQGTEKTHQHSHIAIVSSLYLFVALGWSHLLPAKVK